MNLSTYHWRISELARLKQSNWGLGRLPLWARGSSCGYHRLHSRSSQTSRLFTEHSWNTGFDFATDHQSITNCYQTGDNDQDHFTSTLHCTGTLVIGWLVGAGVHGVRNQNATLEAVAGSLQFRLLLITNNIIIVRFFKTMLDMTEVHTTESNASWFRNQRHIHPQEEEQRVEKIIDTPRRSATAAHEQARPSLVQHKLNNPQVRDDLLRSSAPMAYHRWLFFPTATEHQCTWHTLFMNPKTMSRAKNLKVTGAQLCVQLSSE